MISFARKSAHITTRWMLLFALAVTMTGLLQVLNIKPVFADDGGYPWIGATQLNASDSDYGYLTCPSDDTGCMSLTYTFNGSTYGTADKWVYYLRNCTSYVAWKMNQQFGVNINGWGNATSWDSNAPSPTFAVYTPSNYKPQVGDIAQWDNADQGIGHVAYVAAVNSSGVATLWEYNVGLDGNFYNTRTTASSSAGTPDHYIHNRTVGWGGNFSSTWGTNRLDVFTPGTFSSTYGTANTNHEWFNGSWQSWETLSFSTSLTSWPAAVSWGSNRIDVFARSSSGALLHAYDDANGWHDWENLGGCIASAPGVSSWGTNRIDVFARDCSSGGQSLAHVYYDGSWHSEETLSLTGGQLASAPAAVSWGSNRIDVFARNTDGTLIQAYYDTNGWHNWTAFSGSCITGAPGVSSWGANRLDVFAQGCGDNGANTNHTYYDGSWHAWDTLPNSQQITSSPSAVSWSTNRIDLFARGASGDLKHRYYDTGGWHDWESLGGTLGN